MDISEILTGLQMDSRLIDLIIMIGAVLADNALYVDHIYQADDLSENRLSDKFY